MTGGRLRNTHNEWKPLSGMGSNPAGRLIGDRRQRGGHEASGHRSFALSHPTMPFFKKSKKTRQPSKQPAALGIPAYITARPPGLGATPDLDIYPEGIFRSIRTR